MRRPRIGKGPASEYAGPYERIVEFSDDRSGGLIAVRRNQTTDQLVVDVYRTDADVEVRFERDIGTWQSRITAMVEDWTDEEFRLAFGFDRTTKEPA